MKGPLLGQPLSPTEVRVLTAFADGLSSAEAAVLLGLTVDAVKNQALAAAVKLGARNRVHAVALALRAGLLASDGALRPAPAPRAAGVAPGVVPVPEQLWREALMVATAAAWGRSGSALKQQAGRVLFEAAKHRLPGASDARSGVPR